VADRPLGAAVVGESGSRGHGEFVTFDVVAVLGCLPSERRLPERDDRVRLHARRHERRGSGEDDGEREEDTEGEGKTTGQILPT